jgi:hypothetical protein
MAAGALVKGDKTPESVKTELEKAGYPTQTAKDLQNLLFTIVNILQGIVTGFGVLALFASVFGIINTQYISVLERTREIGLMKATEQLASMEMIGVDPLRQIVAPRLWAGIVSLPMLTVIFATIGIIGGKLVGVDFLGADEGSFWGGMQSTVQFGHDIFNGTIIKSIVFALICTWVAVYQGYACDPTPEGIATSMTRTVVYSSLCVLGFDFVLTAVMFGGI